MKEMSYGKMSLSPLTCRSEGNKVFLERRKFSQDCPAKHARNGQEEDNFDSTDGIPTSPCSSVSLSFLSTVSDGPLHSAPAVVSYSDNNYHEITGLGPRCPDFIDSNANLINNQQNACDIVCSNRARAAPSLSSAGSEMIYCDFVNGNRSQPADRKYVSVMKPITIGFKQKPNEDDFVTPPQTDYTDRIDSSPVEITSLTGFQLQPSTKAKGEEESNPTTNSHPFQANKIRDKSISLPAINFSHDAPGFFEKVTDSNDEFSRESTSRREYAAMPSRGISQPRLHDVSSPNAPDFVQTHCDNTDLPPPDFVGTRSHSSDVKDASGQPGLDVLLSGSVRSSALLRKNPDFIPAAVRPVDVTKARRKSLSEVKARDAKTRRFLDQRKVIHMDPESSDRCTHTEMAPSSMMTLAMELLVSKDNKAATLFEQAKKKADDEAQESDSILPKLWVVPKVASEGDNLATTASHLKPRLKSPLPKEVAQESQYKDEALDLPEKTVVFVDPPQSNGKFKHPPTPFSTDQKTSRKPKISATDVENDLMALTVADLVGSPDTVYSDTESESDTDDKPVLEKKANRGLYIDSPISTNFACHERRTSTTESSEETGQEVGIIKSNNDMRESNPSKTQTSSSPTEEAELTDIMFSRKNEEKLQTAVSPKVRHSAPDALQCVSPWLVEDAVVDDQQADSDEGSNMYSGSSSSLSNSSSFTGVSSLSSSSSSPDFNSTDIASDPCMFGISMHVDSTLSRNETTSFARKDAEPGAQHTKKEIPIKNGKSLVLEYFDGELTPPNASTNCMKTLVEGKPRSDGNIHMGASAPRAPARGASLKVMEELRLRKVTTDNEVKVKKRNAISQTCDAGNAKDDKIPYPCIVAPTQASFAIIKGLSLNTDEMQPTAVKGRCLPVTGDKTNSCCESYAILHQPDQVSAQNQVTPRGRSQNGYLKAENNKIHKTAVDARVVKQLDHNLLCNGAPELIFNEGQSGITNNAIESVTDISNPVCAFGNSRERVARYNEVNSDAYYVIGNVRRDQQDSACDKEIPEHRTRGGDHSESSVSYCNESVQARAETTDWRILQRNAEPTTMYRGRVEYNGVTVIDGSKVSLVGASQAKCPSEYSKNEVKGASATALYISDLLQKNQTRFNSTDNQGGLNHDVGLSQPVEEALVMQGKSATLGSQYEASPLNNSKELSYNACAKPFLKADQRSKGHATGSAFGSSFMASGPPNDLTTKYAEDDSLIINKVDINHAALDQPRYRAPPHTGSPTRPWDINCSEDEMLKNRKITILQATGSTKRSEPRSINKQYSFENETLRNCVGEQDTCGPGSCGRNQNTGFGREVYSSCVKITLNPNRIEENMPEQKTTNLNSPSGVDCSSVYKSNSEKNKMVNKLWGQKSRRENDLVREDKKKNVREAIMPEMKVREKEMKPESRNPDLPLHSTEDDNDFAGVVDGPCKNVKEIRAMFKKGPDYANYAKPKMVPGKPLPTRGKPKKEELIRRSGDYSPESQVAQQIIGLFKGALTLDADQTTTEALPENHDAQTAEANNNEPAISVKDKVASFNSGKSPAAQNGFAEDKSPVFEEKVHEGSKTTQYAEIIANPSPKSNIKEIIASVQQEKGRADSYDESLDQFYDMLDELTGS